MNRCFKAIDIPLFLVVVSIEWAAGWVGEWMDWGIQSEGTVTTYNHHNVLGSADVGRKSQDHISSYHQILSYISGPCLQCIQYVQFNPLVPAHAPPALPKA